MWKYPPFLPGIKPGSSEMQSKHSTMSTYIARQYKCAICIYLLSRVYGLMITIINIYPVTQNQYFKKYLFTFTFVFGPRSEENHNLYGIAVNIIFFFLCPTLGRGKRALNGYDDDDYDDLS